MICISPFVLTLFGSLSEFVENALKSATEAGKKTSIEADEKFEMAIRMLSDYQIENPGSMCQVVSDVWERMARARENDESASTILNGLKARSGVRGAFTFFFVAFSYLFPAN
jgi:hypothetical protein